LHGERQAPLRQHVVLVLRGRAEGRPRRDEGEAEAQAAASAADDDHHEYDYDDDDAEPAASAAEISSRSHSGTRVGRSVRASAQAWPVEPVATSSPSRSTRYSKRKRAPRTSAQRE